MTIPSRVERNEFIINDNLDLDIQPREKLDDDANQLSEHRSHVKKYVGVGAACVEIRMILLTE